VRVVVEQVIQTATKLLDGGHTRGAVTVLATLTREAEPAARRLRVADPDRAATYRELILVLWQELGSFHRRVQSRPDSSRRQLWPTVTSVVLVSLGGRRGLV
jgi:hypothetical protein